METRLLCYLLSLCAILHHASSDVLLVDDCTRTADSEVPVAASVAQPGNNGCSQVANTSSEWWVCSDLQTAMETIGAVAQVGRATFGSGSTASSGAFRSGCVAVVVPAGVHYITAPLHFGNTSVHLMGRGGGDTATVTIYCDYTVEVNESRIFDRDYEYPDYVMYFNRSESVGFEGIEVIGCPYPFRLDTVTRASIHNSTFRYFSEAVFDIYNSPNISITDSSFLDNRGTGISRYSYRGNTGAVAIGYNDIPTQSLTPSALITRCNFTNNSATAENQFRTTNTAFFSRIFSGRGGGVGVFFNESFHNATVMINDNYFERNFARSFGAAVFLVLFGEKTQQSLILQRNMYISNTALLGGGAILNTYISSGVMGAPHMTNISDSLFFNNTGQTGGAIFVYISYEDPVRGASFVKLERCQFIGNHGVGTRVEYGAAVGVYLVNQFRNREAPRYQVIDCSFEENYGINGIFSIGYAPVTFKGNTTFTGNNGTSSLTVIGTLVEFFDNVTFANNSVGEEGALHLLSFGQFRLRGGTQMTFQRNVGRFGASILIDTPTASIAFDEILFNPQCFVLYESLDAPPTEWNDVSVKFRANRAILGSSLYVSRLGTCSWMALGPPYFNKTFVKQWPIWDYGNDSINTGYSDPYNTDYQIETVAEVIQTSLTSVTAWPGQRFTIALTGWDQFRHPTTANARFLFSPNQTTLGNTSVVVSVLPEVVVIDVNGETQLLTQNFTLSYTISVAEVLDTDQALGSVEIDAPFDLVVVEEDSFILYPSLCPAGYALESSVRGLECQCKENVTQVILCEEDQDRIVVETGFWVTSNLLASEFRHEMYFYPCPPGYCRCNQNSSLGETSCAYVYQNSDPDAQCVCNRQGVLCGECRHGRGVSALFNQCVTCSNSSGLLLVILILLDVIVFVLVALADTPLPQWAYPFIFYVQIVPYVALYFPESFEYVGKALYFISSATSFYFIYDFCLYASTSPLFSYFVRFTPLFIALLLFPLIILFRKKRWRVLKHHGAWWIVLLLYSHVVYTSMSILNCPVLPPGRTPKWFVNGEIKCFTGWHAPLALLAIAALLLCIALVPITALISVKIHRKSPRLYWLQFLVSPLTVSFKKEWRWWSSVELGRRFVFFLFLIPFPRNFVPPVLMICIMLTLYGLVQPYKSKVANLLEMAVEINFILLLLLPSTQQIQESLFQFSPPSLNSAESAITNRTCNDELSSIAPITWLLFPLYYLPLLGLVAVGVVYLVLCVKRRVAKHKESKNVKQESIVESTYATVYHHTGYTSTELELEESTVF